MSVVVVVIVIVVIVIVVIVVIVVAAAAVVVIVIVAAAVVVVVVIVSWRRGRRLWLIRLLPIKRLVVTRPGTSVLTILVCLHRWVGTVGGALMGWKNRTVRAIVAATMPSILIT
jgi:hypothetical protein